MSKILLVEDDNNLREIYEARLQAEGYDIVSAKDGEEALVVAKAEQPDLIISDVMMPKISGFEMLDILRNTPGLKETKVIMLTALGQAEDQTRANRLGADRYLVKSQVTLEDIVKESHALLSDGSEPNQPEADAAATSPSTSPAPQVEAPSPAPPTDPQPTSAITPSAPPAPLMTTPEVEKEEQQPNLAALLNNPPQVQQEPAIDQTVGPPSDPPPSVSPPSPTPSLTSDNPDPLATPLPEPSTSTVTLPEPVIGSPAITVPTPTPQIVADTPTQTSDSTAIAIDANGQLTQTEAQETATMDQQITDFLKTAPDSPSEAITTTNDRANEAANDQTLAQAVDNMMSGNEPSTAPNVVTEPPVTTPQTEDNSGPASVSNDITTKNIDGVTLPVSISGKKVIKPLNQPPEKSLDQLIAQEEALEIIKNKQAAPQNQPARTNQFENTDPNNISL